jgi:hypothetical protein
MTQQDMTFGAVPRRPAATKAGSWTRLQAWDSRLSVAKGLTLVTLLTGFFGGYFQYLNAYEDKVSTQAKADMESATTTFVEISNAFAQAHMLQELIFYDYSASLDNVDIGDKQMTTQAGRDSFSKYVDARASLRQSSSIFAHKAEMYIDWASDLGRDPAAFHELDGDPLNEAALNSYHFDCDSKANLPQLSSVGAAAAQPYPMACRADIEPGGPAQKIKLCPRDRIGGPALPGKTVDIDWSSAKHHVLVLHYCFEQAHRKILSARVWASQNPVSDQELKKFQDNRTSYKAALDHQAIRLNAFMTLTMARLEGIRAKYRPSGFFCHVPLVRDAMSKRCEPPWIAENKS